MGMICYGDAVYWRHYMLEVRRHSTLWCVICVSHGEDCFTDNFNCSPESTSRRGIMTLRWWIESGKMPDLPVRVNARSKVEHRLLATHPRYATNWGTMQPRYKVRDTMDTKCKIQSMRYKGYKAWDTKCRIQSALQSGCLKYSCILLRMKLVKHAGRGKHSINFMKLDFFNIIRDGAGHVLLRIYPECWWQWTNTLPRGEWMKTFE